jgi:hypothetical protein
MPTETKLQHGKVIRFWKAYYPTDGSQDKVELPREFWQAYWKAYPRGHPEDPTPRQYVSRDEWDDSKHGYFHSNGRLIYKHPDGTIYHQGVTGVDQFHA